MAKKKKKTSGVSKIGNQLINLRLTVRSFYPPLSISAPFLKYLKPQLHRKERYWHKDVMSAGIDLGTSRIERCTLTTILAP